jgi:hypothetical protein
MMSKSGSQPVKNRLKGQSIRFRTGKSSYPLCGTHCNDSCQALRRSRTSNAEDDRDNILTSVMPSVPESGATNLILHAHNARPRPARKSPTSCEGKGLRLAIRPLHFAHLAPSDLFPFRYVKDRLQEFYISTSQPAPSKFPRLSSAKARKHV